MAEHSRTRVGPHGPTPISSARAMAARGGVGLSLLAAVALTQGCGSDTGPSPTAATVSASTSPSDAEPDPHRNTHLCTHRYGLGATAVAQREGPDLEALAEPESYDAEAHEDHLVQGPGSDVHLGAEHRRQWTAQAHLGRQRCRQPAVWGARVDHWLQPGPFRRGRDGGHRWPRCRRQAGRRLRQPPEHQVRCQGHGSQRPGQVGGLHRHPDKGGHQAGSESGQGGLGGANRSVRRIVVITCDDDDGFRADGHRVSIFVAIAEAR